MAKIIFVLGAGCSRRAGAPLMFDFFDAADRLFAKGSVGNAGGDFKKVAEARSQLQHVHSKCNIDLANLETVFTAFDLAKTLGKLPGYDDAGIDAVLASLKRVIAVTLEYSIQHPNEKGFPGVPKPYGEFGSLIKEIISQRPETSCALITFNYDMLIDLTLMKAEVPFSYYLKPEAEKHVPLLKLHGSLNWVQTQNTGEVLEMSPWVPFNEGRPATSRDGTIRFPIRDFVSGHFSKRNIAITGEPVIVPPTWTKGDHQRMLAPVWRKAAAELQDAEHIIVAGYSLPESDLFFKFLYGLGTVGSTFLKSFTVYDPSSDVSGRFEALLGPGARSRFGFVQKKFEDAVALMKTDLFQRL